MSQQRGRGRINRAVGTQLSSHRARERAAGSASCGRGYFGSLRVGIVALALWATWAVSRNNTGWGRTWTLPHHHTHHHPAAGRREEVGPALSNKERQPGVHPAFHRGTRSRSHSPLPAAGSCAMLAALREMMLATATGGVAAGTAGYFVLHGLWSHARAHGELANSYTMQLQRMRGVRAPEPSGVRCISRSRYWAVAAELAHVAPPPTSHQLPPSTQTVKGLSVMELRLREELALWWMDRCWAFYDSALKWV